MSFRRHAILRLTGWRHARGMARQAVAAAEGEGMTKLHELASRGQAIWLDHIRRSFILSGELDRWIERGLRGITSNPTIFQRAIAGGSEYDADLAMLARDDCAAPEIFDRLVADDIARAADRLRRTFDQTRGADGYVSLEVSPLLAHDAEGTILEARRLFAELKRPNVMIKVPATPAGVLALPTLIADGINVNVTLIFSVEQYETVAGAYLDGLEARLAAGRDLASVASVASVFVSRIDTAVDRELEKAGNKTLQGGAAIANAKLTYARFRELFAGPRWDRLAAHGASVQRLLWASTSTKNPAYPDTMYVDNLIGADTVNTLPPATLQAFLDHGDTAATLEAGLQEARLHVARLAETGIGLAHVGQRLQDEGVASFARSYEEALNSISLKRAQAMSAGEGCQFQLHGHRPAVDAAIKDLARQDIIERIWRHDHTVWSPSPVEVANRLGWLDIGQRMLGDLGRIERFVEDVRSAGYTQALLLGMGGSSLAPEMFREVFGVADGYPDLAVLDSTSPAAVLDHLKGLDLSRTLFIVSTKSGGTVETLSFMTFFYNRVVDSLGKDAAGEHFIAITAPGSSLAELSGQLGFRDTFLNDPDIGGRYSALSYFGLLPAALIGVDVKRLLRRANQAAETCRPSIPHSENEAAKFGVVLGTLAQRGLDKLTLAITPALESFGDWVEQLIAESTGKGGVGILPVVGEPLGPPDAYENDRLFVDLRLGDDQTATAALDALESAGHPVVRCKIADRYDLGGQIFLWEMATAVAGHILKVNPFDQPNVEAAKVIARDMTAAYRESGALPRRDPALEDSRFAVYGAVASATVDDALATFLDAVKAGAYIALQAYVKPTADTDRALLALRTALRDQLHVATTVGYGPRFLHSTGQLHKGDAGNGLFVQFTADEHPDAPIPDGPGQDASSLTFGALLAAQAMGDQQALTDAGRRVMRIHIKGDAAAGLRRLIDNLLLPRA